jgi:hypothetical protein
MNSRPSKSGAIDQACNTVPPLDWCAYKPGNHQFCRWNPLAPGALSLSLSIFGNRTELRQFYSDSSGFVYLNEDLFEDLFACIALNSKTER